MKSIFTVNGAMVFLTMFLISCDTSIEKKRNTFGNASLFLKKHQTTIILSGSDTIQKILVCPGYQGRVMTSTVNGKEGASFGWINYDFISAQKKTPHINPYGGEDRIWFGPEGGQYSLFFNKGSEFNYDKWQVPPVMDTEGYDVEMQTSSSITLSKKVSLINYSGFTFNYDKLRKISMLNKDTVEKLLGCPINLPLVGYQSENTVTNAGTAPWEKESGLISIWIMGMFPSSDKAFAMVPVNKIKGQKVMVNDGYFNDLKSDRLLISDSLVLFKTDGKYRSKIGINSTFSKNIIASYDLLTEVLTIILFNKPSETGIPYVNSLWKEQENPYAGDVINSYNDGPNDSSIPNKDTFYELESSSPALWPLNQKKAIPIHSKLFILKEIPRNWKRFLKGY